MSQSLIPTDLDGRTYHTATKNIEISGRLVVDDILQKILNFSTES